MGNTALALVALKGHAACIPLLIAAGADKDAKNTVRTDFCGREWWYFLTEGHHLMVW
jgi:hypothetical protein